MHTVLRWWAANPWGCWALALFAAAFSTVGGAPAFIAHALLIVSWISFVQGLRTLWHRSRWLTILLAIALVGFVLVAVKPESTLERVAVDSLLLLPLGLAALVEWAIARARAHRGALWLDAPVQADAAAGAPAPDAASGPAARRRLLGLTPGCLVGLGLTLAFAAYFVVELTAPGRHASATRAALKPGQAVPEIIAAARGPFMCTISRPAPAAGLVERIMTWSGESYSVYDGEGKSLGSGLSREAFLRLLREHSQELASARRVALTVTSGGAIPLRVSFAVRLDETGRLVDVSPSRAWD